MRNCLAWCIDCGRRSSKIKPQQPRTSVLNQRTVPPIQVVESNIKDLILPSSLESFTFDEIKKITKRIREEPHLLGEGGFGRVFKGFITEDLRKELQPQPVAVRRVDGVSEGHKEWLAEVMFLGHHSHSNLVKLIGYNYEDEHCYLVYEYLALGSLENNLHSRVLQPLSWSLRMKVAFGVAEGLTYLHEAEKPVLLEKIASANILLDEDYNPKLSDFEYVRNGPEKYDLHYHRTINGYEAPENLMTGRVSTETDVYSFGVVLLELLTGRKAVDTFELDHKQTLVQWARPFLEKDSACYKIVDPRLNKNYPIEGVHKVAMLIYQCLSKTPTLRPSMREVMEKLKPHLVTDGDGNVMPSE